MDRATHIDLLGRLALHYRLVTQEQLKEAELEQVATGQAQDLADILLKKGWLQPTQIEKLQQKQEELLANHAAKRRSATAPCGPEPHPASARSAAAPEPEPAQAKSAPAPAPPQTASRNAHGAAATLCATPLPEARPALREKLHALLRDVVATQASDLHLHSGAPLRFRLHGKLVPQNDAPLPAELAAGMLASILTPEQRAEFETRGEVDFAYTAADIGRFRANCYRQHRGVDGVFRSIPVNPPTLTQLGMPDSLGKFTEFHQGMVLVTGPVGCGKSATLAALLNLVNEQRPDHIVTIEDPIETLHPSKRCLVNQRQVNHHTKSFARALRAALREDPDVIAIGELRDLESISLALTAAETGHFVLATLHTNSALRTVERLIGVFPPNQQSQIRTMVSESLRAVISQRLVARADGKGRVPALEVLVVNRAVGNLIRENKSFQIRSILQTGAAQGMCLLDHSLTQLVKAGTVTAEEARRHADDPKRIGG